MTIKNYTGKTIPVIDIFAGPGGLGEGFSRLEIPQSGKRAFKIALSIEMEMFAHRTLTLRSFFRQFEINEVPKEYYRFVKGKITLDELYAKYPEEAGRARHESWQAKLGTDDSSVSTDLVDHRITEALKGEKDFLLIGGPPCQAYSLVGRSRRKQIVLNEDNDEKVGLYKQYLRILAVHNPAVFVMENVKGLLSARTEINPVFQQILSDLKDPAAAYSCLFESKGKEIDCPGYHIYSLVVKPRNDYPEFDEEPRFLHKDFLIKAENYGIPQARHRVILLGVRKDINIQPEPLQKQSLVPISKVLKGLPHLRSGLSRRQDAEYNWKKSVKEIIRNGYLKGVDRNVHSEIKNQLHKLNDPAVGTGSDYLPYDVTTLYRTDWYLDEKMGGVCNHQSRTHMKSDLFRYFFAICYANVKKVSPILEHFPEKLLPKHKNVQEGVRNRKFADRFRVQLWDEPAKTVTSHIAKDGHYYIHPDPSQCRSLTVREAARLQTFPDNYYFCGPKTAQYTQVGNAVPPLLANQIAEIVFKIYKGETAKKKDVQPIELQDEGMC